MAETCPDPTGSTALRVPLLRFERGAVSAVEDCVAAEEPLEIRVAFVGPGAGETGGAEKKTRTLSITMRTPGDDLSLAVGFLLGEGLIKGLDEIAEAPRHTGPALRADGSSNVVVVTLVRTKVSLLQDPFATLGLERNFYTSSSCGICGKTSLEAVRNVAPKVPSFEAATLSPAVLTALPTTLRQHQATFASTGGLHAAGLFDREGACLGVAEDVGRHNAVDKILGQRFLAGALPADGHVLLVSGRASFELVQKAVMAGVPTLCAVGAPSSLAVELARELSVTLIGFLRGDRFNVYSGAERLVRPEERS
jgi:FdhD protein